MIKGQHTFLTKINCFFNNKSKFFLLSMSFFLTLIFAVLDYFTGVNIKRAITPIMAIVHATVKPQDAG